jgi:hypothetical protein
MKAYPVDYRAQNKVWGEKEDTREYFEKRGCLDFRGYTTTFPQRPVSLGNSYL